MLRELILFAVSACALAQVLPGGPYPMKKEEVLKNDVILKGLDIGVNEFNARHGRKENQFRLVQSEIEGATKQVVAGFLYRVRLTLVESQCSNTDENDGKKIDECPAGNSGKELHCKFLILHQPWKKDEAKKIRLTGKYC